MSTQGSIGALRDTVARAGRMVVAFSGGVDSALLAWVARDVLGPDASLAVTAVSPSLAPSELSDCRRFAEQWDLRWREVQTDEGSRPGYEANGTDRCYHCKSELMDHLAPLAQAEGAVVALGVNLDDLSDHRPGQRAATERGAVFPLVDAGFTKVAVRAVARDLGLEAWDKPSGACLASRVPYGTPVTLSTLNRVATRRGGAPGPRVQGAPGASLRRGGSPRVRRSRPWKSVRRAGRGRRSRQGGRLPVRHARSRRLPLRKSQRGGRELTGRRGQAHVPPRPDPRARYRGTGSSLRRDGQHPQG